MSADFIIVKDFTHRYSRGLKSVTAVQNINFSVPLGSVVGLLGPNGAGKSTTIRALLGLIEPTSGEIRINGFHPGESQLLNRIGIVCEIHPTTSLKSANEQLRHLGKLSGLGGEALTSRIRELTERFGIAHAIRDRTKHFSKGMIQRLGFVQALLHDPEILILDEPTTGLDPDGRKLIIEIIEEQRELGKTIFFSTHILSDAERVASRVLILHKGSLVASKEIENITDGWQIVLRDETNSLSSKLALVGRYEDQNLTFRNVSDEQKCRMLAEFSDKVILLQPDRKKLEELFVEVTKGEP